MKAFLRLTAVFAVLILLTLGAGEIYVRHLPNPARDKHAYMLAHSAEVQTLVLGSSHTFYARLKGDDNHNASPEGSTGEVTFSKTIPGVKAGQWRKIALSIVYSETGDIDISVKTDSFVQDEEIVVNGSQSLWEPILEEPSGLPELTWPDHDLAEGMKLNDAMYDTAGEFTGSAPVLTLTAPHGIRSAVVSLTTDNPSFRTEIIESGNLTDVDLCGTL